MISRRQAMEKQVVQTMIGLYCRKSHVESHELCSECADLLSYAHDRIEHCPEGALKPFCSSCPIHCYEPERREAIRKVMRFSGPRMLLHHPLVAIRHLLSSVVSKRS